MDPLEPDDPRRVGGYRLLGRLGVGGMGVVYLGRSPGGRTVAVKVVRERHTANPSFRARFRREAAAARRVTGTFTAPILDADPDATVPWLVTAYLPGLTLREAVRGVGALAAPAVRVLAVGLAEALADIHRAGVVHRDLKPANIILTAYGPRVIDFGIARPEDATEITRVGALLGTVGFMSPEQASRRAAGPESDVFSLGAVLLYAATGKEPFGGGDMDAVLRRVSAAQVDFGGITDPGLAELVGACMRRKPGERPAAVEVLEMLDRLGEAADPPSAEGTGWLPAALLEVIDRRAAEVRPEGRPASDGGAEPPVEGETADPVDAWDGETAEPPDAPDAPDARTADPTADPVGTASGGSPRLSRRALLVSAPVTLAAAGAVGFVRARDTEPPRANAVRTPRASAPAPPPKGVVRWSTKVGDYYPMVSATDGVVVAEGRTGEVHALDTRTGEIVWKRKAGNGSHTLGDSVYLSDPIQPWLTAVEAVSGDIRWQADFSPVVHAALSGSLLCFGYEGPVRAVDVRDGGTRWTADVSPEAGLGADARVVAAASTTSLAGLDARSGRERWTYRLDARGGLPGHTPLVGAGLVLIGDGAGVLHAVRADDGAPAWRKGGGATRYDPSSLRLSGGVLYAGGGNGSVVAMDAATGAERWSRFLDAASVLAPSGGTLFAACASKKAVYALNAADGRVQWSHEARTNPDFAPLASVGGVVFIGTRDGRVEAVGGARAGS